MVFDKAFAFFQQVPAGACFEQAYDVADIAVSGKDEESGGGAKLFYLPGRLDAVKLWHYDVHDNDVRF